MFSDQIDLYRSVTELVEGSTAGVISTDSSNIVELVRQQYEAITTSIKVQDVNSSKNCQTEINAVRCKHIDEEQKNSCKNIPLGTPVDFELKVKLKKCRKETFVVQPVGLKDKVSNHLHMFSKY